MKSSVIALALCAAVAGSAAQASNDAVVAYANAIKGTLPQNLGAYEFTEISVTSDATVEHIYRFTGDVPAYFTDDYFKMLGDSFCQNDLITKDGATFVYKFNNKDGSLYKEVIADKSRC